MIQDGGLGDATLPQPIATMAHSLGVDGTASVITHYLDWADAQLRRDLSEPELLRDVAHAMRPSSEMLGLEQVAACCREISGRFEQGEPVNASLEAARLRALVDDGMVVLRAFVARLGEPPRHPVP